MSLPNELLEAILLQLPAQSDSKESVRTLCKFGEASTRFLAVSRSPRQLHLKLCCSLVCLTFEKTYGTVIMWLNGIAAIRDMKRYGRRTPAATGGKCMLLGARRTA